MENNKHVLILGAGPAGLNAAKLLATEGFRVTIVDKEIGGNYCRSGSVISNSLLYQSKIFANCTEKLQTLVSGDECSSVSFDFKKSRKLTEQSVMRIRKALTEDIENLNINFVYGFGKFASESSVAVTSVEGNVEIKFDYCIIATGSSDINPGLSSSVKLLTVSSISDLEKVPSKITILGGGFVGCEFATVFRRLGSAVTIVETKDEILRDMDQQIVKKLEEKFKKSGIEVLKNTKVEKAEKVGSKYILFLSGGVKLETEEVFVAVGRKASICGLDLDKAGIKLEANGNLKLNKKMRTTNANVYAVGDASGGNMLVSWAYTTSEIASDAVIGNKTAKPWETMPKVLYLDPELAKVGFTEDELKDYAGEYACIKYNISDLEKTLISGAQKGYMKVVYDKDTRKILGCHVIGDGAGQICSMFSLLIQSGITIDKISDYVFNHPTYAEVLNDIASKVKQ
ncbi:NAD(P)/FAD-dependent oxidoreductase [Geovibrio thiophilus]|uniref:NAD(P)/FAD-dependent oxidoreductase n=2 Tax=Geovibrio thiophilus TaxID=139438 RepID=A0A3R5Y711_9BACT|nr:NAD(P)/FAD-dependent oxidoreductase [Geovibrio thiophilus]QAR33261.1 NAD(P)/FAD-dependent oxidoreductase [Geovibrio thiophilus]